MDPVRRFFGRIDVHVEQAVRETIDDIGITNKVRLDELSGQIDDVRRETLEVRRIVTDDLDASNETAALLGRTLASLQESIELLRTEVTELKARLDR